MSNSKTVLITGPSRGLGIRLVEMFLQNEYSVIVVGNEIDSTIDKFSKIGDITGFDCDLSNQLSLERLEKSLADLKIDILINNAGTQGEINNFLATDPQDWKKCIQVNFIAPAFISRAVLPNMVRARSGSIINFSGGGVTFPRPNFSAYASSKAALVNFSATLAQELIECGVRVNCIAPGPMPTDMLREILAKGEEVVGSKEYSQAKSTLDGKFENFETIYKLCQYLASDESKFITGKLISALWDPWEKFSNINLRMFNEKNICTMSRISPEHHGLTWDDLI
jgi:3-oxoacyl-[acyl-carrier protein] reductase